MEPDLTDDSRMPFGAAHHGKPWWQIRHIKYAVAGAIANLTQASNIGFSRVCPRGNECLVELQLGVVYHERGGAGESRVAEEEVNPGLT